MSEMMKEPEISEAQPTTHRSFSIFRLKLIFHLQVLYSLTCKLMPFDFQHIFHSIFIFPFTIDHASKLRPNDDDSFAVPAHHTKISLWKIRDHNECEKANTTRIFFFVNRFTIRISRIMRYFRNWWEIIFHTKYDLNSQIHFTLHTRTMGTTPPPSWKISRRLT